ncbi:hypothetical protein N0B44_04335 [Roseibacterium beibuensis]|uniref:Uncharacterized protein n=1 Tax=[Roseibacterium] beibuensis TaxID=1193142 RepID=A0ABP9KWG7_9RHOB|nr:hypothetical protein [Roseibacterium beibuensis]MCS6622129.1 hypothetical protein [Roseibacterium beibuensis]
MERFVKNFLCIVFPGMIGSFTSCILIIPPLMMRGLDFPSTLAVAVILAGAWSALFAIALRNRVLDQDAAARRIDAFPAE